MLDSIGGVKRVSKTLFTSGFVICSTIVFLPRGDHSVIQSPAKMFALNVSANYDCITFEHFVADSLKLYVSQQHGGESAVRLRHLNHLVKKRCSGLNVYVWWHKSAEKEGWVVEICYGLVPQMQLKNTAMCHYKNTQVWCHRYWW